MKLANGVRIRSFLMICGCLVLATACAKVPSQKSYKYSYQNKMQSAGHWEKLAGEVVSKEVAPFFTNATENKPESILGVYIEDKDASAFGTAFQTYLTTKLFEKSIPVSEKPENAFTIEWSVQKVIHNSKRRNPGPPAGIFGTIAYAVGWIFGGDYYSYSEVPNTELLITVEIRNGNIIYSRTTETLYINDEDTYNYWVIPERNASVAHTFVREGALVCREPNDLFNAYGYESEASSQFNALIKEERCAVMNKPYPVTILEKKDNYSIIRSDKKPHYIYVTSHNSLGD